MHPWQAGTKRHAIKWWKDHLGQSFRYYDGTILIAESISEEWNLIKFVGKHTVTNLHIRTSLVEGPIPQE